MVGNCFLVHYLKSFRAKDGLLLETDGEKESCIADTIPLVNLYTGYRIVYGNTQAPPSNKPGTRFLQTLKKLLW